MQYMNKIVRFDSWVQANSRVYFNKKRSKKIRMQIHKVCEKEWSHVIPALHKSTHTHTLESFFFWPKMLIVYLSLFAQIFHNRAFSLPTVYNTMERKKRVRGVWLPYWNGESDCQHTNTRIDHEISVRIHFFPSFVPSFFLSFISFVFDTRNFPFCCCWSCFIQYSWLPLPLLTSIACTIGIFNYFSPLYGKPIHDGWPCVRVDHEKSTLIIDEFACWKVQFHFLGYFLF